MSLQDNVIFSHVKEHADHMLEYGRGCKEDPSIPLFGNVVCPHDKAVKTHQVIPPPGIRINDFSWAGNNLMHDVPFLETLIALTQITGDARYEQAVDAVFDFYPSHCPHPETGLFPWGEHAQWSFSSRRGLANCCHDPYVYVEKDWAIHEHLRFAPAWFWERMWRSDPECVVKFAHGLNFHLMNLDTFEHNRHAPFNGRHWNDIPYLGQGKDFARHAGFFIFDCLFAHHKSGDASLLEWARRKIAYQMGRRHPDGILKGCIRTAAEKQEGQHDSFACALFDAAKVLGEDTAEGREIMDAARELLDARVKKMKAEPRAPIDQPISSAWNWSYGAGGSPLAGSTLNQLYDRTRCDVFAAPIIAAADWQMSVGEPPCDIPIVTWTFDTNLRHLLDAYAITNDRKYLDRAHTVAMWTLARVAPEGLFLGVVNMEYFFNINIQYSILGSAGHQAERPGYYFSGTGVPSLLRNLLRLALLEEGGEDILGTESHCR